MELYITICFMACGEGSVGLTKIRVADTPCVVRGVIPRKIVPIPFSIIELDEVPSMTFVISCTCYEIAGSRILWNLLKIDFQIHGAPL